jgi:hypothetical protein
VSVIGNMMLPTVMHFVTSNFSYDASFARGLLSPNRRYLKFGVEVCTAIPSESSRNSWISTGKQQIAYGIPRLNQRMEIRRQNKGSSLCL